MSRKEVKYELLAYEMVTGKAMFSIWLSFEQEERFLMFLDRFIQSGNSTPVLRYYEFLRNREGDEEYPVKCTKWKKWDAMGIREFRELFNRYWDQK